MEKDIVIELIEKMRLSNYAAARRIILINKETKRDWESNPNSFLRFFEKPFPILEKINANGLESVDGSDYDEVRRIHSRALGNYRDDHLWPRVRDGSITEEEYEKIHEALNYLLSLAE